MNTLSLKNNLILPSFFLSLIFSVNTVIGQTNAERNATNSAPIENSLSYISRLKPVVFNYKAQEAGASGLSKGESYGFSPEEVEMILPGLVKRENKMIPAGKNAFRTVTVKTIDLEKLVPILVGSIKEQQAEIEALKKEIQSLKSVAAHP